MNNINIMGRLTAHPELKSTPNGISVCQFTVAVDRPHSKDTTDFIRCVAWRKTAEFIDTYFSKGKMIALCGCLTSRSWKDEEGKNHSIQEVLVDQVYFCGDKGGKSSETKKPETPETPEAETPSGFEAIDNDIPF